MTIFWKWIFIELLSDIQNNENKQIKTQTKVILIYKVYTNWVQSYCRKRINYKTKFLISSSTVEIFSEIYQFFYIFNTFLSGQQWTNFKNWWTATYFLNWLKNGFNYKTLYKKT